MEHYVCLVPGFLESGGDCDNKMVAKDNGDDIQTENEAYGILTDEEPISSHENIADNGQRVPANENNDKLYQSEDNNDDNIEDLQHGSNVINTVEFDGADDLQNRQFLNNDVLEVLIKLTLCDFPFMRSSLRCVNIFFRSMSNKVPYPEVYILELPYNYIR